MPRERVVLTHEDSDANERADFNRFYRRGFTFIGVGALFDVIARRPDLPRADRRRRGGRRRRDPDRHALDPRVQPRRPIRRAAALLTRGQGAFLHPAGAARQGGEDPCPPLAGDGRAGAPARSQAPHRLRAHGDRRRRDRGRDRARDHRAPAIGALPLIAGGFVLYRGERNLSRVDAVIRKQLYGDAAAMWIAQGPGRTGGTNCAAGHGNCGGGGGGCGGGDCGGGDGN